MLKKLLLIKLMTFFEIRKQEARVELSGKSWDDSWRNVTSINIPPLQKRDNTFAFTVYEKAEELNSYFASISTIDDVITEILTFKNRYYVDFTQIIITETEVIDILKIL